MSQNKEALSQKLKNLPEEPGVYLMKNASREVIYVGKAKILKNRVRSYFNAIASTQLKTKVLMQETIDFEVILTRTESEAILLERTLIRHHHPRYNIMLKDGKEYPYLRIDYDEPWPRLEKVRRRKDDGAFYVGPFSSAGYLNTALKLAGKIFPLIRCSRHEFKVARRPCNYYHMKMCLGPCTLPVPRDEYILMLKSALAFLMGKNKEVATSLKQKMLERSAAQDFEAAAGYRDQLFALEEISKKQTTVVKDLEEADIIAALPHEDTMFFHVLMVRESRVIGGDSFASPCLVQDKAEAVAAFISQYYEKRMLPVEIVVEVFHEDLQATIDELKTEHLTQEAYPTKLSIDPKRGTRHDLMAMAIRNAEYHLEESVRESSNQRTQLEELQRFLGLTQIPNRIECVDISHLQGQEVVGAVVCFVGGKPATSEYRRYRIKTLDQGAQDDYHSIREVLERRIRRGLEEDDFPDVFVVDGGKAQLEAALSVQRRYPEARFLIVSLAKARPDKKDKGTTTRVKTSYERVFFPHRELAVSLIPGTPVFRVMTQLRDEAHRFALRYHRERRSKATIPGS